MLKTCLLYCSIYPENYGFNMRHLVMRWVAQGFIYEEAASEGYFKELACRGLMLPDGQGTYQMNPMMRNFLRCKSCEDDFFTCSSGITSESACPVHLLCIDEYPVDDGGVRVIDLDWSQVRTLVVFKGAGSLPFEKLEHVRVLDLQDNYVDPESEEAFWDDHVKDICGLLRMRHLFGLGGVGVSKIPLEIGRLQYLETLEVVGTSIRELPVEIGALKQLKTLDMSINRRLTELPMEIGGLQHLETLRIRETNITKPPWEIIGMLKKLKNLDVSVNEWIRELPREIRNLHHLETLDLSRNRGLTNIPGEIGKLQHLKTLNVSSASITRLPSEIGRLKSLETLDLSYNKRLTELPREIGNMQNLKHLLLCGTMVGKIPREIGGLKKLKILILDGTIIALVWEVGQFSELEGVPECIRQAWKNGDLVSELAGETMSYNKGDLTVGTKHMHIPPWIKQYFNNLLNLDIRICKLEEPDLKILREMPNLCLLRLRFVVVPRKPISISGKGFPSLMVLVVDSRVPRLTFQEGAMPKVQYISFEFRFYGGLPNEDRLSIKHLRSLGWLEFTCNKWYRGAGSSPFISAMVDVARKEAQEHPNQISFRVSGCEDENFPANKSAQVGEASSSGTGEIPRVLHCQK
ncbi:hypothetical protein CFC21_055769 [Triticum aestivum]|uniref:NB-ARC domain-containing protein n=2 Tax=Triticum aestivum TaxID=4565 RepID=A0A9R1GGR4_WHEAT|nr:hypothetical protein CFC21_055769 [Triticum aestivum]